ncbi:MAG: TonB-dependent receptor [candidate division KSB1 bacterium]|nr:TonB-dependent receptor [candidate division KSB1 bacterium]MDZ7273530.1 TonB-dependent receptor [candidate division KSB1 bacterium]MDZ7286879.1 TonB-dependent receptor [candidate division KSB1 bacterium]MDZ7299768.1 TonB-dependent receptor [candidate division KSB1 bacterium]MDZ7350655.1 TonB-dependent receptor [candidate division KSB1 bacterium]
MKTLLVRQSWMWLFLLMAMPVFAQGSLQGVVSDSATAEKLPGASVYLVGTALGSATNLQGAYRIDRIPAGSYTLRVSYIGYRTRDLPVTVADNTAQVIDIKLGVEILQGAAITVTGQAVGQAAAINQQRTAPTIINVVSEEKIRELPDANAAEAIGRLPGVSVQRSGGEANKVILRGLQDKFTVITIDGVKIPATDATSRGVDLSTLSQSSLAGIELYKAATPDKDGDALAGSINLVTKAAPAGRNLKVDLKGDYNRLMNSARQYDFSLHYGERFFNQVLGVQVTGNLEKRIRSNERIDVDYTNLQYQGFSISDFLLEFTDEIRKRDGFSLLLDVNTPDNGTIRCNTVLGRTRRDYFWSTRDYPAVGGGSESGAPVYDYRDREQEIYTLSSSIRGDNRLLGWSLAWGAAFAQSVADYPFDYEMIFVERPGMRPTPTNLQDKPEQLIAYALNDFSAAGLSWTYYRKQRNFDKERTAHLELARKYLLGSRISGEIKFGGKYKIRDRSNVRTEDFTPYYLGRWQRYELLPDGTFRPKDFTGTPFESWLNAGGGGFTPMSLFFDTPVVRQVYGSYRLTPLIDRNRLRQWYELNRYGIDVTRNQLEVWTNPLIRYDDYDITERIAAGYLMNTLQLGQGVTVIGGVRIEREDNDYASKFMPQSVGGFPVPANSIRDTTSSASQTVVLPNLNLAVSPLDFMKVRLAVYKALARPDFNMRLERYIAGRPAEVGSQLQVFVGNPRLKTARAWNYEVNTSFFSNTIGLISLSAFYKEITGMYHMLNNFNTTAVRDAQGVLQDTLLQRFGIKWPSQMGASPYNVTLPYNSPRPTKVWGFEFEHQINFDFLPGLLKNIVLTYNASLVRSQAFIWTSRIDSVFYDPPGPIPPTWRRFTVLTERKQKLEGMPEFFGNVALGYDLGRFSGRVSVFHQGEHNVSYSAGGLADRITMAFTRVDLTLKQGITDHLALFASLSNATNLEDGSLINNNSPDQGVFNRRLFNQSEKYGLTANFGLMWQLR